MINITKNEQDPERFFPTPSVVCAIIATIDETIKMIAISVLFSTLLDFRGFLSLIQIRIKKAITERSSTELARIPINP